MENEENWVEIKKPEFNMENESYDIEPELIISDIINKHSKYLHTEKNMENLFGYDLNVYQKNYTGSSLKRYGYDLGYIECEHSHYERLDEPHLNYSFLRRKIHHYNRDTHTFTDTLKYKSERTIYIIFNENYELDDCYCAWIPQIPRFNLIDLGFEQEPYFNAVYRTPQTDGRIPVGIENCIKYMEDFFYNGDVE